MNQIKKCSIAGVSFTIERNAYDTLSEYIQSLHKTYKDDPDGEEIIADIEARIAELILSAVPADAIVTKPLILNIIKQLGSAEEIDDEEEAEVEELIEIIYDDEFNDEVIEEEPAEEQPVEPAKEEPTEESSKEEEPQNDTPDDEPTDTTPRPRGAKVGRRSKKQEPKLFEVKPEKQRPIAPFFDQTLF